MEWYRSNRKQGIDGGWYIIATHGDEAGESLMIEDELCVRTLQTYNKLRELRSLGEKRGEKKSRFQM